MLTLTVKLYRCEHCRRKKALRSAPIRRHEINCFSNPARTPYPGELAEVRGEGKMRNYGSSDALPGGMDWLEWVAHDPPPPWWPGSTGQIFTGTRWVPVPGYERRPATGAHGCAGGAPDEEIWRTVPAQLAQELKSSSLESTRPWYRRLELLGIPQERFAEHLRKGDRIIVGDDSRLVERVTASSASIVVEVPRAGWRYPYERLSFAPRDVVGIASYSLDMDAALAAEESF